MRDYLVNLSKKQKLIIIISLLIVIVIVFIFIYKYFYDDNSAEQLLQKEENTNEINNQISNEIGNNNDTVQSNNKIGLLGNNKKLIVHVIGEVKNPGVVKLEDGARIIDAIDAAGGKTEDADLSKVNLAYVIEDGIQIYIPRVGEVQTQSENEDSKETYIRENAGEGVVTESLVQNDTKDIKVNINTATVEKLQTLPGIGESTAKKIIQYREQNGKFETIEDLKKVNGIGESKYNNLKDYITV